MEVVLVCKRNKTAALTQHHWIDALYSANTNTNTLSTSLLETSLSEQNITFTFLIYFEQTQKKITYLTSLTLVN